MVSGRYICFSKQRNYLSCWYRNQVLKAEVFRLVEHAFIPCFILVDIMRNIQQKSMEKLLPSLASRLRFVMEGKFDTNIRYVNKSIILVKQVTLITANTINI